MKLYVVVGGWQHAESCDVLGVFESLEKAEEAEEAERKRGLVEVPNYDWVITEETRLNVTGGDEK